MTVGETTPTQTEIVTQEAVKILTSKILKVISKMRELMVQIAPVLFGGTSAPPPPCESITTTIMGTESSSASPVLMPATNSMEELTLQIVGQFFVTMRYCIKLILSRRSPFKFM